jgi:Fibronectin type III domain
MTDRSFAVYATTGDMPDEIDLQWDNVPDARKYIVQITQPRGNYTTWKQIDVVTNSHYTVTGLKRNVKYGFRVAAVMMTGRNMWSSTAIKKNNALKF